MSSTKSQDQQRKQCLAARRALSPENRERAAARIQRNFLQSSLFFSARTVACYLATSDEVDTSLVIDRCWRAGKQILVPVLTDDEHMEFVELRSDSTLKRNRYGLWEPAGGAGVSAKSLDVIVTPVVAFDAELNRIGMGGGYFDRAFAFLHRRAIFRRPKLVGFAFECQKVEEIRPNPWDIRLYRLFCDVD